MGRTQDFGSCSGGSSPPPPAIIGGDGVGEEYFQSKDVR